jgi:hypothetical protein
LYIKRVIIKLVALKRKTNMATTRENIEHLSLVDYDNLISGLVVENINKAIVASEQARSGEMLDRIEASGLAFKAIDAAQKARALFVVETAEGGYASISDAQYQTISKDAREFVADNVTNIDDMMYEFSYHDDAFYRVKGAHCVARVVEYPAA